MRSALIWTSVFFVSLVVGFLIRPASGERAELHPDEPPPVLVEPSLPDEAHRSTSEPQADDFDAALEAIPIPDLAPAKAPITGRVIDPDDQGVAGVRIIARPVLEAASDEALADRVVAWAVSERLEPATIEATTDADGFFALSPLLRASYEITAEREDLSILPSTPIENPARPGDWVTFVAHRGIPYEIEIDVIAPGGSRASDAYVVVREPGERDSFFRSLRPWVANHEQLESSPFGLAFHWTPSSRLFRVRFDCEIEAHLDHGVRSEPVHLRLDSSRSALVLECSEPTGIRVELRYPQGEEKIATRFGVLRIDPNRPPSVEGFARGAKWINRYANPLITEIPSGTYWVGAMLGDRQKNEMGIVFGKGLGNERGGRVDGFTTVKVGSGIALAVIEFPEPNVDGAILVRAYRPDGELADRLDFVAFLHVAGSNDTGRGRRRSPEWRRLADGSYALWLSEPAVASFLAGETDGKLVIEASHDELGRATGEVLLGNPPRAELRFNDFGALVLDVSGLEDRATLRWIHARFWSLDTPSRQFVEDRETSVKTGTIHYRHVTPGEYRLSIELASSVGDLRFADATVRISSGETVTLPVAVPALHRLKLRFPDGYRRPRVFIRGGDTELILRRILEPQVELRLPEGVYEVVEPAPGEREGGAVLARFRVPATEEVEIPRRER